MAIVRELIGKPIAYKDHLIEARRMGPDLLCFVDGVELPNFYLNVAAVESAGVRYIDDKLREVKQNGNK